MDDYTYQTHEMESGTHILVFKNGEFERKVFVSAHEYNPDETAYILGEQMRELYFGSHDYVIAAIKRFSEYSPKSIAVGKDFQILSVEEYISLHG